MRKIIVTLILLAGGVATALLAQSQSTAVEGKTSDAPSFDAQVEALVALPPAERRAALKSLDPEQRRGLWLAVKRALREEKGAAAPSPGHYRDAQGHPVNVTPQGLAAPAAVGTIRYDNGFPTIGFGGGALVGNRFDTHTAIPVLNPGTVSTIQALVVPGPANTTSSAGFVLLGPQTTMGGAMALFSTFTAATGVIDSLTFAGLGVTYTGSSFFVLFGDFATVYVPVLGTGSTLAQGHHGVVGYTGMMGPNITDTFDFGNALNSFIRATGNIVPVELMTFEVD
jgi:hypothetical protein